MKQVEIKISKRLSDKKGDIQSLMETDGFFLLDGDTGIGKTFTMSNTGKETDRIVVIACPNKCQNEQNETDYGYKALIQGVSATESDKHISMVYDKADDLRGLFKGKKKTLIIDEAHKLIDDYNFRKPAIDKLEELAKEFDTVIHTTATSRKLLKNYNYDSVFKVVAMDQHTPIKNAKIIPTDHIQGCVLKLIHRESSGKIPVVFVNSNTKIKVYKKYFEDKGLRVGVANADNKGNDLYRSIVERSEIPSGYDVILTTCILECGTNINNTNCVPILVDPTCTDSIKQAIARFRKNVDNAYIVVSNKDPKDLSDYEIEEKGIRFKLNQEVKGLEHIKLGMQYMNKFDKKYIHDQLVMLNNVEDGSDTSKLRGLISIDEDNNISINERAVINYIFMICDRSKKTNYKTFLKAIEEGGKIQESAIEFVNAKEYGKELNPIMKDIKGAESLEYETALQILEQIKDEPIFIEYLHNAEEVKKYLKGDIMQFIGKLEREKKVLDLILKGIRKAIPPDIVINMVLRSKDPKEEFKKYAWIQFNNNDLVQSVGNNRKTYNAIRRVMDEVMNSKSKRVTNKKLLELFGDLGQIDVKYKKDWEKYEMSDSKKRKKILDKVNGSLLNQISSIYIIGSDNKIHSLKSKY